MISHTNRISHTKFRSDGTKRHNGNKFNKQVMICVLSKIGHRKASYFEHLTYL